MKVTVFVAVGWMVAFIAYTSFMVNGRHTKMEELLISHIISNLFRVEQARLRSNRA